MTRLMSLFGCIAVALIARAGVSNAASTPPSRPGTITCPFLKEGSLTIDVPARREKLPKIDFDYPSKATLFSFRDNNLFLVAMDESEPSRLRVVVSAQLNKKSRAYDGQIFVDMGGNQLMHYNGPVHCTVTTP
jgi:hypothetical protein